MLKKIIFVATSLVAIALIIYKLTNKKKSSLCDKCGCGSICGCDSDVEYRDIENPEEFFKREEVPDEPEKFIKPEDIENVEDENPVMFNLADTDEDGEITNYTFADLVLEEEGEAFEPNS